MKKYLLVLLMLTVSLVGSVSAYGIYLNCSDSVPVGQTLKCSIDSDFPAGTGYDVTLFQSQYTATEIANRPMTIQSDHGTQYVLFDTTGLKGGQYKVEIVFNGAEPSMRSDSISSRLVTISDRSDELTLSSSTTQNLADALTIAGSLKKAGNDGVQIQVDGEESGRVFGPQWIQTTNKIQTGDGQFSKTIPVTQADDYTVVFSDNKGTIATVTFTVTAPTVATTAPPVTTIKTIATTKTTVLPTPLPTTTKSPLPVAIVLGALGFAVLLIARMKKVN